MDVKKIGEFIACNRKNKGLTQEQLGEKLGVSNKTISRWENGNYMPDLSLLKPLSEEIGITLNELLNGEKIEEDDIVKLSEESLINTIDYTNKKIANKNNLIGLMLIVFGILLSFVSISIFTSESSWGSIYSVFGAIISLIGVSKFTKKLTYVKRVLCNFGYFILFIIMLFVIDYISVVNIHQAPRFCFLKETGDNVIIYKTPFYNVYRINYNNANEYYIIDTNKNYTESTVPISPFNREKSGVNNIIKYKNKYVGNNSNDSNLINKLPLSEYNYVFAIDSDNLGLTINYSVTDWYIDNNFYLEKSLIYNSVSIFQLIENLEYLVFNFSGNSYKISRDVIEKIYPNYDLITSNLINNFDKYLENRMNDEEFVKNIFNNLFQ